MSNIVAVLIVRCTHTGVYADGRPNTASVTIYDLDESTIQKNRTRSVPVPVNSTVDIPMSTRTFVSWHDGDICKFTRLGLITSEIILQLRDKGNCGGPAGTGQALRPAVLNIERVANELRMVIPDNVIPTVLDSVGFLEGEPVTVTGLTGAFRNLNGEYEISSAAPGDGLAGAAAGSYLVVVPSEGPDIAAATLAGVNLCLTEGRVTSQFNATGDTGGLGSNVFGYIGGQLFPNVGGGGGGETLAQTLVLGNLTGGTDIAVSTGDSITGITDLVLDPGGGGGDNVVIDALTWPSSDGTSGQVLTTDGAGILSFTNPSSIEIFTSGEALTAGDLLTLDTAGDAIRADSSIGTANYEVIGVANQTVGIGVSVQVVTHSGEVPNVNFTAAPAGALNGGLVFLSTSTGLASTAPPGAGGNAIFTIGTLQGADGITTSPAVVFRPQLIALRS